VGIVGGMKRLSQNLGEGAVAYGSEHHRAALDAVNALDPELQCASDGQLRDLARVLRRRATEGERLDELLVEVFALVREVASRTIGLRPFDVQVVGGIGLFEGKVVQMQTGEGKTLAAVSPAVLRALTGQGVHVLTFNDYLAQRDAEWMGPIYRLLSLTVGHVQQGMDRAQRRDAYQADVTYVTAKEAGFDLLRDGLAYEAHELVHRPFHVALVDEADSILVDEARVPLVIAGATDPYEGSAAQMRALVEQLVLGTHYATDEYRRNVYLLDEGMTRAEQLLGCGDLYDPANLLTLTELNLALHAEALMSRDVDYIVRRDRIEMVDDFTGRVVEDRHWPDGLQAAIEAKERVRPSREGRVLGSITLQHFLRGYPHLCGMTATAEPAADELYAFYGLELLVVPPNRPCIRIDYPDVVFTHKEAKRRALVAEIDEVHRTGRPILVGTLTVEESEALAGNLRQVGISCDILNAKRDAEEARIVAEAGARGAITISTNMAGRGTDIRLGGSKGRDYAEVAALGGLYVIGTNRHESRRIDDQLRGRAGRQGDPGSSRFFISLEDDLLVRYGIDDLLPERIRPAPQLEPVDSPVVRREIARAQRIVEGQNYDIRRTLWRYSHFVETQRRIVADRRGIVLRGEDLHNMLQERCVEDYARARHVLGETALQDVARRLTLFAIDECWADHLAAVTEIRDGIHLVRLAGRSPINEFIKGAAASFEDALNRINDRVVEEFLALDITSERVDLAQAKLRGPSSTWTYLVNDKVFELPSILGIL
jgi:preprotein translocase subunit SecA